MKLVQKLTFGLSLACVMFMSSCSKEDVQTPEPQMESVNASSNAKMQGGIITPGLPYFAPTYGQTGVDIYPNNWKRAMYPGTPSVAVFPTGVSNRTHAFGIANQWVKPLPAIPSAPDANSFVTITTKTSDWDVAKRADAVTKIKYLEVGQKYSIDFYVATTAVSGPAAGYARQIFASVDLPYTPIYIDMVGKTAEWVKQSIVFKAWGPETSFYFGAASEHNTFAYAHIFVDKNSIKKVL